MSKGPENTPSFSSFFDKHKETFESPQLILMSVIQRYNEMMDKADAPALKKQPSDKMKLTFQFPDRGVSNRK
jgi:hypothetical protein